MHVEAWFCQIWSQLNNLMQLEFAERNPLQEGQESRDCHNTVIKGSTESSITKKKFPPGSETERPCLPPPAQDGNVLDSTENNFVMEFN